MNAVGRGRDESNRVDSTEQSAGGSGVTLLAAGLRRVRPARRRTSRALTGAIATVLGVALLVGPPPSSAYAYSVVGTSGSPGTVGVPYTYAKAAAAGSFVNFDARDVYRSPAYSNRTQVISVTYRVYRWEGAICYACFPAWRKYQTSTQSVSVAPGYKMLASHKFVEVAPHESYSVDVRVVWKLTDGTVIGTKVVDYDARSDYQCWNAESALCHTVYLGGSGGVYLGSWGDVF